MDAAREFQQQLTDFVRAFGLHQPDRTACGEPISTSEAHALGVLAEAGPKRVSELAHLLVLEKSTVSRIVASMAARSWIRTADDPADGRARLIGLTAHGRRAAARLASARGKHFGAVLAEIAPERRAHVIEALEELTRASRATMKGELNAHSG